ncbi:glycerol-3-phosphate dehydrogenase [NAD(P)+], partial [Chytriomyces confervae]
IGREVLEAAKAAVRVGVTTDEIDRIVHEATISRNAYPSPLNYYNFPKSCCTSVNEVICHGIPDRYALQDGDILNIDISVFFEGFHSDLNETVYVGNVDAEGVKLVETTRLCLEKAIEFVKPGNLYRDIGEVIQKIADEAGLSVVRTYCGHGINKYFHCSPSIPHYAKNKAVGVMKPGHIFTIEPMICEGGWKDEQWPDRWTAVTQDGKRSAQFEETLLVTETEEYNDTNILVLGAGNFGTCLADHLAALGNNVTIYARDQKVVDGINDTHCNIKYIPFGQ